LLSLYFFFSEKIDKKKLFKIARKNALSLVQQGVLPVGSVKKDSIANIPTKTVDELTGIVSVNYFINININ
jgi:hypothetical protein